MKNFLTITKEQTDMTKYIIGIDTGGTYTDGVLLEQNSTKIIAVTKTPTSHHDLAIGTGKVLAQLIAENRINPSQVYSVALSTTLATNSVVENKGARVALIVIGYVKHFKLPVKAVTFVKGGHNLLGEEEEPLDLEYLVSLVDGLKNEVDAFGVCSAMSMNNPAHELVAEKAISMLAPKPVFCSHKISQQAGMEERAATAGLHAKLMPIMDDFVAGVQKAMEANGLTCPIGIVSGNGKIIPHDYAVANAAETIASGPACTARFGALSAEQDSLVIDIGGTTTDIARLEKGKPVLSKDGCTIGLWKTRVEAVDMFTGGIGGDSLVSVNSSGKLTIGPTRVTPFSNCLKQFPDPEKWLGVEDQAKCIQLLEKHGTSDKSDIQIIKALQKKPLTAAELRKVTGLSGIPLQRHLENLTRKQLLIETGFTPTDALHVLGRLDFGNTEKAKQAAAVLAKLTGETVEVFCTRVVEQTEQQIETMIIDYIVQHYWGKNLSGFLNQRKAHPVLEVAFSLKIPLIGIGAAAKQLLPGVAKRLGTTVHFPDHCEVGNAVGAALISDK